MEINIYSGQRVLFKNRGGWQVGTLIHDGGHLWEDGLYFDVYDKNKVIETIALDNLFLNARKLEDWEKDYLFEKQAFLNHVEENSLRPQTTTAYISDGEYIYYPIAKFNINWLNKQPFDYIMCND